MKIVLVRHGQTEDNFEGIMQGTRNVMMNDTGRRQCKKLREKLNDKMFDVCYMSPLVRCVETAFILVGDKTEMIKDDRLIERDLGKLEGKNREVYDIEKYWNYDINSSDDGVESVKSVIDRCESFLEYIKSKYDKDTSILIVTHNACFRALRLLINKKELKGVLLDGKRIDNCDYEEFEI